MKMKMENEKRINDFSSALSSLEIVNIVNSFSIAMIFIHHKLLWIIFQHFHFPLRTNWIFLQFTLGCCCLVWYQFTPCRQKCSSHSISRVNFTNKTKTRDQEKAMMSLQTLQRNSRNKFVFISVRRWLICMRLVRAPNLIAFPPPPPLPPPPIDFITFKVIHRLIYSFTHLIPFLWDGRQKKVCCSNARGKECTDK